MRKQVMIGSLVLTLAVLLASGFAYANPRVSLVPQGFGFKGIDSVKVGENVIFQMYFVNDENLKFMFAHGFRIYSPDGAVWSGPVRLDTTTGLIPSSNFDLALKGQVRRGGGEDTLGTIGAIIYTDGIPAYFNGPSFSIHIGSFSESDIGKHICIDSSWYWPGNEWQWLTPQSAGLIKRIPDWTGPYCFTIIRCCNGMSGDLGAVGTDNYIPDIGDLGRIIDYLFGGKLMSTCPGEVDLDRSGAIDINDMQKLTDFLFESQQLPSCP